MHQRQVTYRFAIDGEKPARPSLFQPIHLRLLLPLELVVMLEALGYLASELSCMLC